MIELHHGDCIEVMRTLPDNSVDSICTDPPYGLGFMGKAWDALPPGEDWARECLRVLKPGGHLLAFGGTRTWHRLAVAVEDAGFEIRDSLAWMHGQGFPKSLDVSKAIDKAAGAEREVVGQSATVTPRDGKAGLAHAPGGTVRWGGEHYKWEKAPPEATAYYSEQAAKRGQITAPATPAAEQWQGWGTALKPAFEPIVMARKPLIGTVAANVQTHGTGALNIDGCRIAGDVPTTIRGGKRSAVHQEHWKESAPRVIEPHPAGRWPANVALDEHMAAVLDGQSGVLKTHGGGDRRSNSRTVYGASGEDRGPARVAGPDSGGASRFFYVAKAPKKERPVVDGVAHTTVKPLALMRWLVRLVTPEGGTVLEPFAGSGTTVEACILEGFRCIAIEREAEYLPLIQARIDRQDAA